MGLGQADISWTTLQSEKIPQAVHPRWAVVGRSNVGKSSFLNAVTHPRVLFRVGGKPGVTIGLVSAKIRVAKPKQAVLEVVDMPGWGYAKRGKTQRAHWGTMAKTLFERSQDCGFSWIFLADPLVAPTEEDVAFLEWIGEAPFVLVFTKSDQVKKKEKGLCLKRWAEFSQSASDGPYWVSALKGEGFDDLAKAAREFVKLHTT